MIKGTAATRTSCSSKIDKWGLCRKIIWLGHFRAGETNFTDEIKEQKQAETDMQLYSQISCQSSHLLNA